MVKEDLWRKIWDLRWRLVVGREPGAEEKPWTVGGELVDEEKLGTVCGGLAEEEEMRAVS